MSASLMDYAVPFAASLPPIESYLVCTPSPTNPLLTASNCVITPHLAWATTAARERLLRIAVANIEAFLKGSPQNVVN